MSCVNIAHRDSELEILKVVVSVAVCLRVMVVRRGIGVVFCVSGLVKDCHVVIQGHEDVLRHDRVKEAVEIYEEGDHLPGEVPAHLEHMASDHPSVVDLRWVILACQRVSVIVKLRSGSGPRSGPKTWSWAIH